jgi:hypothetical protein
MSALAGAYGSSLHLSPRPSGSLTDCALAHARRLGTCQKEATDLRAGNRSSLETSFLAGIDRRHGQRWAERDACIRSGLRLANGRFRALSQDSRTPQFGDASKGNRLEWHRSACGDLRRCLLGRTRQAPYRASEIRKRGGGLDA